MDSDIHYTAYYGNTHHMALSWGVYSKGSNNETSRRAKDGKLANNYWLTGSSNFHQDTNLWNAQEGCSLGLSDLSTTRNEESCISNQQPISENDLNLVLGLGCPQNSGSVRGSSGRWMPSGTSCEVLQQVRPHVDLRLGLPRSSQSESYAKMDLDGGHASVAKEVRALEIHWPTSPSDTLQGLSNSQLCGGDAARISCTSIAVSEENSSEIELQLGLTGNSPSGDADSLFADSQIDHGRDVQIGGYGPMAGEEHSFVLDEGSTSRRWMKSIGSLSTRNSYDGATIAKERAEQLDIFVGKNSTTLASSCEAFNLIPAQVLEEPNNAVPLSSNERALKTCKFQGCGKGARGASGLCIAHGGGRRCQRLNCNKGAEGRTLYCKAHGGGRRCQHLGCIKSAEGKTDFCIGHGGGRRCSYDGCSKAARGRSGLCIRHGGGKRCQQEGCTRSAEGFLGLCISHGGGRRCQFTGCGKGAQGSTAFCKAHGGGRRCEFEGCTKGAEGSTPYCKAHGGGKRCTYGAGTCTKSVHGGTAFCVAHGGGKRCTEPGCSKSARGRTDYCVRHGGGKRCQYENCTKSAQGSTDFCKAHGGGKKCSWNQEGSVYSGSFVMENQLKGPCDKFARGKTGLCAAHMLLVQNNLSCDGTRSSSTTPTTFVNGQVFQSSSDATEASSHLGSFNNVEVHPMSAVESQFIQSSAWSSVEGSSRSGHAFVEGELLQVACEAGYRRGFMSASSLSGNDNMGTLSRSDNLYNRKETAFATCDSMAAKSTYLGRHWNHAQMLNAVVQPSLHSVGPSLSSRTEQPEYSFPNVSSDDISTFSLSVSEGRVHGGGLMALLEKEVTAAKQRYPQ